jgi:hypothetical protein
VVPFFLQPPGFSVLSAMITQAAIGEVTRFPGAKKPVGYAGPGAGVLHGGKARRSGHITKAGTPQTAPGAGRSRPECRRPLSLPEG